MTREDVIRMALEHFGAVFKQSDLEVKLAVLAVAAEREACAKVAEEATSPWTKYEFNRGCMYCAKAIRSRGET